MRFKVQDHYFKKAKQEGLVARSYYKLEEIDRKYHILSQGQHILDCGYFPGSWIQYTAKKIGSKGFIVGVDLKEKGHQLNALIQHPQSPKVITLQDDLFNLPLTSHQAHLNDQTHYDVILSDMAPSTTGQKLVDQAQSFQLTEQLFNLAHLALKEGGDLVAKYFESQDVASFIKGQRIFFQKIYFYRPKATRSSSTEAYVIAKGKHS